MPKKLTTEEFITRSNTVHSFKYDYSKVKYLRNNIKVVIVCPEHGEFFQVPSSHLIGIGCWKCISTINAKKQLSNNEDFIEKAAKVHNFKFDYSKVDYLGSKTKIIIICPEHGEFLTIPNNHLNGNDCPECGVHSRSLKKTFTTKNFIEFSIEIHGMKYDYSKVKYMNSISKIEIICPEHGEFLQIPSMHLQGNGCPKCNTGLSNIGEFIKRANEVHNNKYDYSKSIYLGSNKKLIIICPIHGEFTQMPSHHTSLGCGCLKCGIETSSNKTTYTTV
jgi:uncharacterized protein YbbK (DUF523 family)